MLNNLSSIAKNRFHFILELYIYPYRQRSEKGSSLKRSAGYVPIMVYAIVLYANLRGIRGVDQTAELRLKDRNEIRS